MIVSFLAQVGLLSVTIIPAVLLVGGLACHFGIALPDRRAIVHPSRRAMERPARPAIRPAPPRNVIQASYEVKEIGRG